MSDQVAQLNAYREKATAELAQGLRRAQRLWQEKANGDVRVRLLTGFAGGLMIGRVVNRAGG